MKNKKFLTEADRKNIISEREKAILENFSKTFKKIKRIDEAYGMSFEEAKAEAKKTASEDGVAQHVNKIGDDLYTVSDFLDGDNTVASFGLGIDETRTEISEEVGSEEVGNEQRLESKVDEKATLAYKLVTKIGGILKDEIHTAPDEYGMTTPELVKTFLYNFDTVENDEGKIIGFRKGDLASFVARAKNYLMNNDLISLNDYTGEVDVNNSNSPKIAQLLLQIENL